MKKTTKFLCLLAGLILTAAPLQARQVFAENVVVGGSTAEKIFTVYGTSNLYGDTTIGTATDSGSLTVYGDKTGIVQNGACKKHLFGYEAFKPMEDQLAFEFCATTSGQHGALVKLTLVTTCTMEANPYSEYSVVQEYPLIYVHPNDVTDCHNVTTAIRINESHYNNAVPSGLQFSPVFRKDGVNRICVGLAKLESWETDTAYDNMFYRENTDYTCATGCLFYEVISCNLTDVTVTATKDVSFDILNVLIQNKLLEMYPDNETRRLDVADHIVGLGTEFINILLDLLDPTDTNGNYNESAAEAVIDSLVDTNNLSLAKIINALKFGKTAKQISRMLQG
ncbi:MAG: hypothetical protein V1855_04220 [bacterium]